MNEMLLTDEEIYLVVKGRPANEEGKLIAQAQLAKVSTHYEKRIAELEKKLTKEQTVWKPLAISRSSARAWVRIYKNIEEHLGKPEHHYHLPAGEFYLMSKRDWQALKSGQKPEVKK